MTQRWMDKLIERGRFRLLRREKHPFFSASKKSYFENGMKGCFFYTVISLNYGYSVLIL